MDVSGMGKRYIDNIVSNVYDLNGNSQKNLPFSGASSTTKIVQNSYLMDKGLQKRVQDIEKVQQLIDELKETKLMKDKESLNPYVIDSFNNSANINFSIEDKEKVKAGDVTINVQNLAKATVIASDDLNTDKALNLEGNLQVNGFDISIEATDSISSIKGKIVKGDETRVSEEENSSSEGTATDIDPATANSNGVSAFSREGVLYLKSNIEGEDSTISLEGSTTDLLSSLGLVGENGDVKNLVQQGQNGKVLINGDVVELKGNELSYDGVKMNFESAVEGETSQIKVSYDEKKVLDALNEFKDKYNELVSFINQNFKDDMVNSDIQNIKYKLGVIADAGSGVSVDSGSFSDNLLKMTSGIGSILNDNLKSAGIIENTEGQIEFDDETLKQNIDKLRGLFNTEDENSALSSFKKNLEPYTAKVNSLEVSKAATQELISKTDETSSKKAIIETALKDNKDMLKFLSTQSSKIGGNLDLKPLDLPDMKPLNQGLGLGKGNGIGFGGIGMGAGLGFGNQNSMF